MHHAARKTCQLLATACLAALLAACGGGNDDDPSPSDQSGVLTITNATDSSFNGIYGDGNINLTDVDKKNPIGEYPEVCTFKFDGANRIGGTGGAAGDIRYRPDSGVVYEALLTFLGREFGARDWSDVAVVRSTNRIRLVNKVLADDAGRTITVNGVIPMRPNRPSGC